MGPERSKKTRRESPKQEPESKPRTALEVDLPFEHLNPLARHESWRKEVHRPLYHVHKWWANRLGSVFRALVLAGNLKRRDDVWGNFYRRHEFSDCIVLDPFMGSGTTIGEALKLGCKAIGVDINPVSHFQVRKALEHIDEAELIAAFRRLESRVAPELRRLYSSKYGGRDAEIMYAFWVKFVTCPDCRSSTRLFNKWIFAAHAYPRRHPKCQVLCPRCGDTFEGLYTEAEVECPECAYAFDPHAGPALGAKFTCEHCRETRPILEAVRQGDTPPEHQLYALMLLLPDGSKVYKRADENDLLSFKNASEEFARSGIQVPEDRIPPGYNTDQARRYNYRRWRQMFNDRQLLALGRILEGVRAERNEAAREFLLLLFSGTLEFNNMFCSFKGEGTGAVRHLFSHHILKPERTPLEANPWGTPKSSGAFSTLFARRLLRAKRYCENPFEIRLTGEGGKARSERVELINHPIHPRMAKEFKNLRDGDSNLLLLCRDSSELPIPDASVDLVITDPPYFDMVNYSELADFFHCWLRIGLGRRASFGKSTTRSGREVQGQDATEFGQRLCSVLKEAKRVLKPHGLIAFTFHHSREDGWRALLDAIEGAELEVTATHPLKAEMSVAVPKNQAKEPINLDLVVVCKAPGSGRGLTKASVVRQAAKAAERLVERYNKAGQQLSRGDVRVILMGGFLKAHSRWLWHGDGEPNGATDLMSEISDRIAPLFESQTVFPKVRPFSNQLQLL